MTTATKTPSISSAILPTKWITPPECQGQTIEVSYASDCECFFFRRSTDRSAALGSIKSVTYEMVDMDDVDVDAWDPINGEPPFTGWRSVNVL